MLRCIVLRMTLVGKLSLSFSLRLIIWFLAGRDGDGGVRNCFDL